MTRREFNQQKREAIRALQTAIAHLQEQLADNRYWISKARAELTEIENKKYENIKQQEEYYDVTTPIY